MSKTHQDVHPCTTVVDPVDSNEAFCYLWFSWRLVGMNPTKCFKYHYYVYAIVANIVISVMLPASLLANLFIINTLGYILSNLSVSITITAATIKFLIVFLNRKNLRSVAFYLKKLDARADENQEDQMAIRKALRSCHNIYYVYNTLYTATLFGFAGLGFIRGRLVFEGWFPYDSTKSKLNYYMAFTYQLVATLFVVVQNTSNDMYPPCYLIVLIAHINALGRRISRIGRDCRLNTEDNIRELIGCVADHKNCLGYLETISPIISLTIFTQFIITAFVLCITAVYFVTFDRELAQLFVTAIYLIVILIEVLPCCYFVNELMSESDYLTTALYNCNWVEQNQKFRKTLIIFMQRTQKTTSIMAGNLAPITLQTFMSIIRFSFSMFAVFSQMK